MIMERILPKTLSKGDTIGVISPSGPVDEDKLKTGLDALIQLGYRTKIGKHVRGKWGYLAGKDEERLEDLHWAFSDDEIDAIFCSRGGYGTNRIIEGVDFELIKSNPKILLGFSDITGLHIPIFQETGLVVFQGPMVVSNWGKGIDEYSRSNLFGIISSSEPIGQVINPKNEPDLGFCGSGSASGQLIGGNLSLLITTLGTPYEIDTCGKILVIEDVGEEPYKIDRYLTHLHNTGKFDKISGLVIGSFTDCCVADSQTNSFDIDQVLDDFLEKIRCPVIKGLVFGHSGTTMTIPIGINASIDADDGRFTIDEGAVI